ncbi:type I-U CRISPR-associated RAMP protein Csb1/Cas7u [Dactylosporangium sp. NPDC051485]|uniref:type I-G CRISPR-associated RAMP protein Csb1/Cas7g n=1 Tax=Dactylosporangium sp. NPDC051485 TaxID=3154846 RepID=UPI0034406DFF
MSVHRTLLHVDLRPLAGHRFQPTGFPDLGAAEFDTTEGRTLAVESYQSMANRLEATTWDEATTEQVPALDGLPYVRIVDGTGGFLSSSRLEAHRLASAYIMNATIDGTKGDEWMREHLGLQAGRPLDNRAVARASFALDPLALVHGVFFARKGWPWQPRITRAVTSFIDAYDVRPAVTGGVKRDVVINEAKDGATAEGYGTVPHHRVEYTAGRITAYFTTDHAQLRAYGLPEPATALLEALIDYEIGSLLDGGLRLRSACDLEVVDVQGARPDPTEAATRITKLLGECADDLGPVTTAVWTGRSKG